MGSGRYGVPSHNQQYGRHWYMSLCRRDVLDLTRGRRNVMAVERWYENWTAYERVSRSGGHVLFYVGDVCNLGEQEHHAAAT
jgi:hypothetical protein